MILLDTHAVIWLLGGHRRVEGLIASGQSLLVSPASLLEIRFLIEAGKVRIAERDWEKRIGQDARFRIDDCRVGEIVAGSFDLAFTRDPFDRLIAGHAAARGYRLATADDVLLGAPPTVARLSAVAIPECRPALRRLGSRGRVRGSPRRASPGAASCRTTRHDPALV